MRTSLSFNKCRQRRPRAGFTLLETVVYTSVFALVLLSIMGALLAVTKASHHVSEERAVAVSAHLALSRMTRDIRSAESVDGGSVLNVHPGRLIVSNNGTTTDFFLEEDTLKVKENGILQGSLLIPGVTVGSFIARSSQNASSTAVRIEMQLQAGTSTGFIQKDFYTSAVLRNGY